MDDASKISSHESSPDFFLPPNEDSEQVLLSLLERFLKTGNIAYIVMENWESGVYYPIIIYPQKYKKIWTPLHFFRHCPAGERCDHNPLNSRNSCRFVQKHTNLDCLTRRTRLEMLSSTIVEEGMHDQIIDSIGEIPSIGAKLYLIRSGPEKGAFHTLADVDKDIIKDYVHQFLRKALSYSSFPHEDCSEDDIIRHLEELATDKHLLPPFFPVLHLLVKNKDGSDGPPGFAAMNALAWNCFLASDSFNLRHVGLMKQTLFKKGYKDDLLQIPSGLYWIDDLLEDQKLLESYDLAQIEENVKACKDFVVPFCLLKHTYRRSGTDKTEIWGVFIRFNILRKEECAEEEIQQWNPDDCFGKSDGSLECYSEVDKVFKEIGLFFHKVKKNRSIPFSIAPVWLVSLDGEGEPLLITVELGNSSWVSAYVNAIYRLRERERKLNGTSTNETLETLPGTNLGSIYYDLMPSLSSKGYDSEIVENAQKFVSQLAESADQAIALLNPFQDFSFRCWSEKVEGWFGASGDVPHNFDEFENRDEKSKVKARKLIKDHIKRIVKYDVPDSWFEEKENLKSLWEHLKRFVGKHACAHKVGLNNNSSLLIGGMLILLAAGAGENSRKWFRKINWSKVPADWLVVSQRLSHEATREFSQHVYDFGWELKDALNVTVGPREIVLDLSFSILTSHSDDRMPLSKALDPYPATVDQRVFGRAGTALLGIVSRSGGCVSEDCEDGTDIADWEPWMSFHYTSGGDRSQIRIRRVY